ncbi:MAG: ArnT family glycosyltransferase [Elusimicrobiota bacterium]
MSISEPRKKQFVYFFIFLLPFFLAAPFLNRAYFVDDSYFVEIATWLKDHPSLPYHFTADDAGPQTRGWEENGFVRMVNPLAHHYYLAFLLKLGGEKEWFLRLGCVFLNCFSALFILMLARRLTSFPVWATVLCLLTPAFWLSSYSLLIDSTAGFFFLGALSFFILSIEKDSLWLSLVSGFFMGLATLSKYPATLIFPLTFVWFLFKYKNIRRPSILFVSWILGLGILTAYNYWTYKLYGAPHIFAASGRMVQVYGWVKILVFFVFLSGVTLVPLVVWRFFSGKKILMWSLIVFLCAVFSSSSLGGFNYVQSFLLSIWAVSSLLFSIRLWMERKNFIFPKDLFLIVWLVLFILMMLVVMGWVAGRYYVLVVPAVVFLVVRMIEINFDLYARRRCFLVLVIISFVVTGSLAYADYKQANTSRSLIHDLKTEGIVPGPRSFYTGDSFTVSYLKKEGWSPCFENTSFQVGDQVLVKEITMPFISFFKKGLTLKRLKVFSYDTRFPIKVMDMKGSAGFYASVWGALPFTFSNSPWERFHLFEVVGVPKS